MCFVLTALNFLVCCHAAAGRDAISREIKSKSATKAGFVEVTFPGNRSCGGIYLLPRTWNGIFVSISGKPTYDALGKVRLPAGETFRFDPNGLLAQNPQILGVLPVESLGWLELDGRDLSPQVFDEIKKLKRLRHLHLDETETTDKDLEALNGLSSLISLHVAKTLVRGKGYGNFALLPNLQWLDLSFDDTEPGAMKNLLPCRTLKSLVVKHSGITDRDLAAVARMENLERLDISDNRSITNKGIAQLRSLKKLSVLIAKATSVTPAGVTSLAGLPLKVIVLSPQSGDLRGLSRMQQLFPGAVIDCNGKKKIDTTMD